MAFGRPFGARPTPGLRALRRHPLAAEQLEPRLALTTAGIMPTLLADPIASATTVEPAMVALADDAYENNDSVGTAYDLGTLTSAKTIGSLVLADSEDWFKFTITSAAKPGDFVSIGFNNAQGNLQLAIYSSYGYLMGDSQGTGNSEGVTLNLLQPGTYYAKVYGAGGAQNPNYSLTISPPAAVSSPVTVFPDVAYYGGSQDWSVNAINAPEAWAQGYTGQGVVVAVVDTGVQFSHPDLNSQIYINAGEIGGNGIDDDHNGYVDDTSGWDFYSNDNYADDGNGHGTHVAGIIAAAANGFGATGVAPGAKIMPIRVLGADGSGSTNSVAAGIRYAVDNGADIINLSLGGPLSSVIQTAIQYAQQRNVLVVSAAGNESASLPTYPARLSASLSNVISVGAYSLAGAIASFSNDVGTSAAVQVDAPGVSIYSTYLNGQYARLSGTSMAAPQVAGLAALALSANPSLTAAQLRTLIVAGTNQAISGSDSNGGVNAAITVALAAAGQTSAGAAGIDANAQLAAAQAALSNWFATLAIGVEAGSLPGAHRLSAIDQVMRGWA